MVNLPTLHDWRVTPSEAVKIQLALAARVTVTGTTETPRFVAGVDISPPDADGIATGVVVILDFPALDPVEVDTATGRLEFPYVPGLLSFREIPLLLEAYKKVTVTPDVILVDGQGYAHPRRLGIASHFGLALDVPTIGCAKSRLCGTHGPVGEAVGSYAELVDKDEVIGAAVRTKLKCNPIYVSIGHKIDLKSAIRWTLACGKGYRVPEPTRLAHLAAAGRLDVNSRHKTLNPKPYQSSKAENPKPRSRLSTLGV